MDRLPPRPRTRRAHRSLRQQLPLLLSRTDSSRPRPILRARLIAKTRGDALGSSRSPFGADLSFYSIRHVLTRTVGGRKGDCVRTTVASTIRTVPWTSPRDAIEKVSLRIS